jgi:hypothetical protein
MVGGTTRNSFLEEFRPVIILFDEDGEYQSHLDFGNDEYEELWVNLNSSGDGNVIGSFIHKESWGETNFIFMKLDPDLNVIWETVHDMETPLAYVGSIIPTADNGYVTVGTYVNPDTAYEFGTLIKLNENGEILWERRYQQADTNGWLQVNNLYDVTEVTNEDGGFAACGQVQGVGTGQDYWVIRVDSMGCLVPGCDTLVGIAEIENLDKLEIKIGPIPTSNYLNIVIPKLPVDLKKTSLNLVIRDEHGKEVYISQLALDNSNLQLDLAGLSSGIYILSLENKDSSFYSEKIIIN